MAAEESATTAHINSAEHSADSSPQRVETTPDDSKKHLKPRNQPKRESFFKNLEEILDINLSSEDGHKKIETSPDDSRKDVQSNATGKEIETSPDDLEGREEKISSDYSEKSEKEAGSDYSEESEKEESSSSDSEEITEEESSSSDSKEITEEESSSSDSEEITEEESSSSDSEEETIAADSEEKDRDNTLYSALIVQACLFFLFQLREILYDTTPGPVSEVTHIIAKQSQPFLLALAVVTVGIEVGCRIKNVIHASEKYLQMAKESLTASFFKAVTVSSFCLNALYQQIGKPDPRVAYAAGMLFTSLIFIEMLVSGKTSAALPSTNYMSIACFVDFFVKSFIFPATIMQLSSNETIVLIGNIMAMVGFLAVMGNEFTLKRHLNSESSNAVSSHSPSQLPSDEENGITRRPAANINGDPVNPNLSASSQTVWNAASEVTPLRRHSESSNQTCWGKVSDRGSKVLSYFFPAVSPQESQRSNSSMAPQPMN